MFRPELLKSWSLPYECHDLGRGVYSSRWVDFRSNVLGVQNRVSRPPWFLHNCKSIFKSRSITRSGEYRIIESALNTS